MRNASAAKAIAIGGGSAGVLDLSYAILVYSPSKPILILQTIASGLLGGASYNLGTRSGLLGVFLHFFIALSAAAVYVTASRSIAVLTQRAVWCGLLYGAFVYAVMHWIVLPLSAVPKGDGLPLKYKLYEFVEHLFFVGLPIALAARCVNRPSGGNVAC